MVNPPSDSYSNGEDKDFHENGKDFFHKIYYKIRLSRVYTVKQKMQFLFTQNSRSMCTIYYYFFICEEVTFWGD